MKDSWKVTILFILPYIFLLILGVWYYAHISPVALFDGDSNGYLAPAVKRQLSGEWHKGERPMQYLFFLYCTLTYNFRLNNIVIAQQLLTLLGGALLTASWLVFVRSIKSPSFLWHLAGYFMLAIYVSSPDLMYFAQFIGPELFSMFFMCLLIFCLSVAIAGRVENKTRLAFLSAAIFVNLYLINPMPKWVFAGLFLEILLVALTIKSRQFSFRHKAYSLALPHLLYVVVVFIPEKVIPTESPELDRVFIEYQQMVYTHFDLLIQDKSNFEVPAPLQDSLVKFFYEAKANEVSNKLLGFTNDYLMWNKGKAKDVINDYYQGNFDSIGHFYKSLCFKLVTKYPWGLTKQISRQLWAFYIPNKIVHKDLYGSQGIVESYSSSCNMSREFDQGLSPLNTWQSHYKYPLRPDLISFQYPKDYHEAGLTLYPDLPLPFGRMFPFFLGFDYIFLGSMLLFFITRFWQGKGFKLHLISLLYILTFIYVTTVGIVHTFDIGRFIDTIYPFILLTTFLAFLYWVQEMLTVFKIKYLLPNETP